MHFIGCTILHHFRLVYNPFFIFYVRHHYNVTDNIFLSIIYRLGEFLIIGHLVNKYWLKSKIMWLLLFLGSLYSVYDLCTYRYIGVLNYTGNAQIFSNIILLILFVATLITMLQSEQLFKIRNQMLLMLFLGYFSIHLVYTVISNYIINQSFSSQSFTMFFCSYILLHIVYYFALTYIVISSNKFELNKMR